MEQPWVLNWLSTIDKKSWLRWANFSPRPGQPIFRVVSEESTSIVLLSGYFKPVKKDFCLTVENKLRYFLFTSIRGVSRANFQQGHFKGLPLYTTLLMSVDQEVMFKLSAVSMDHGGKRRKEKGETCFFFFLSSLTCFRLRSSAFSLIRLFAYPQQTCGSWN